MTFPIHSSARYDSPQSALRKAAFLVMVLLLTDCTQIPPMKTVSEPQARAAAWDLVDHFAETIPDRFWRTDSIVFTYRTRVLSFLGYSRIDSQEETFSVAGLTPLGIKLFQFSGDAETVNSTFVEKDLAKMGNAGEAIAGDIRRIYFDNIPDRTALLQRLPGIYLFTVTEGEHRIEYSFATISGQLVRKRQLKGQKEIWKISYQAYQKKGPKAYPQKIVMTHSTNGYQLEITLKQSQDK